MYNCVLNNALLFDGLASRFEFGFASEQDDVVFDRLIGGTIRLGTAAPKNIIVRGLTGDGRYFYSEFLLNTAVLWVFTAWRTVRTTAVAVESQQKIINITSRWSNKFCNRGYRIFEDAQPLDITDNLNLIKLCGILAVCGDIAGNADWQKDFLEKFTGKLALPQDMSEEDILVTQLILYAVSEIYADDAGVMEVVLPLMREIAKKAAANISKYLEFTGDVASEEFNPDWRAFSAESPTSDQLRVLNEEETVSVALQSIYALLYSRDSEQIKNYKDEIIKALKAVCWDKLILATSLTPLAGIHAKGVEYKLWDDDLAEYTLSFNAEDSLVANFLQDDYDENNGDKAGHVESPAKKPVIELPHEEQKSTKKKRKRRRKNRSRAPKDKERKVDGSSSAGAPDQAKGVAPAAADARKKPSKNRRRRKKPGAKKGAQGN